MLSSIARCSGVSEMSKTVPSVTRILAGFARRDHPNLLMD